MVTLQILVLPFKVRILVGQLFHFKKACKSKIYRFFCFWVEGTVEGRTFLSPIYLDLVPRNLLEITPPLS